MPPCSKHYEAMTYANKGGLGGIGDVESIHLPPQVTLNVTYVSHLT